MTRHLPFHDSLIRGIHDLRQELPRDVEEARIYKKLLGCTAIPPEQFRAVRAALNNKIDVLNTDGGSFATSMRLELVGARNALDQQMEEHRIRYSTSDLSWKGRVAS